MRIALDAMGGDFAPKEPVKAAVLALQEIKDLKIILVGDQNKINEELKKYKFDKSRIEIKHTDEFIAMDEKESPAMAVRKKKNASMNIALELVKNNEASGCVSAGNTGALMSASLLKLGRIKGVMRPAITIPFPTKNGACVLMDVGANADCKPEHINQFAVLGSAYAEVLFKIENPTVAILNIGTEEGKGNELTNAAYSMLIENKGVNFVGNIEPKHISDGEVDVIVTDGFTGNIVLKTAEGTGSFISRFIKNSIKKNVFYIICAMVMTNLFKNLKRKMDPSEYGGAIFLGLDGISIKAHGSSDAFAIKNGIKITHQFAKLDFIKNLKEKFNRKDIPESEE